MKIAIAQLNPVIGDFDYNKDKIIQYAEKAIKKSCDLVIFTELILSGYPPRDLLEKKDFVDAYQYYLDILVKKIRGIGVVCGLVKPNPEPEGNSWLNTAVLFEDGKIIHECSKRLLPTYDIFDETRYFEPGHKAETFFYKGRNIGLTICEDIWNDKDFFKRRIYHIDPVTMLINKGADLLINISASPYHLGKRNFKWDMLSAIAAKYRVPLIYANQVGGNDSVLFDGLSVVFDKTGEKKVQAKDFEEDLIVFDMGQIESSGDWTGVHHPISETDIESLYKALVMGTKDYVTKCGFSKVVIGSSGGIDSALTACIAVDALGKENVSTVFMPSPYTAKDNFTDTEQLANNLGVSYSIISIDKIFCTFLENLSDIFKNKEPDTTEENIQARIRGTILMAISNKFNSLVLSTGNKSELAVGYCTLYGDMSGGLAVISDVPKTTVYELSGFVNRHKEIIPANIFTKAPSAELKPDQTDQDVLPPYEVLDPVLKAYIEEARSVDALVEMGFDRNIVEDVVQRVARNEYKRYQAAPGLRVTSKAFGYGRRYPLAQRFRSKKY
ncbi:MAG: NAD+ synthase [Desulfobacterales bacterium]